MRYLAIAAVGFAAQQLGQQTGLEPLTSPLLGYGMAGIVVVLFLMERITTPGERNRLREENALLHKKIEEQNNVMRDSIIPALVRSNDTNAQIAELLSQVDKKAGGKR